MWFVATRNRPDSMRELIAAAQAQGDMPPVAVMEDGCLYDIDYPASWMVLSSTPHIELTGAINALFRQFPNHARYGLLADHNRPAAPGWWRKLEAAAGPWGIACATAREHRTHPRHGWRRLEAGTCIGGELARALGWLLPPCTLHLYADDILEAIGHELGCLTFLEELLVDDLRVGAGEGAPDANHARLFRGEPYAARDAAACEVFMKRELRPLLAQLRAVRPC